MFTKPFSLHFIFCPLPTVIFITRFRHLSYLSSCVWYTMTLCYHLTILRGFLHWCLLVLLHRIWFPRIGCRGYCLIFYFLSPTINIHVTSFSTVVPFTVVTGLSCIVIVVSVPFFCSPNSFPLCGRTCHTCCICPRRILYSCFPVYFIWRLTLEPSLMVLIFLVFFFCLPLSSKTNVSLSSGLSTPYFQYLCCNKLSLAFIPQVRHRIHFR